MNGSRTPDDVRARFRAEYLISGNASASARKVGLPESTGRDLAQQLCEEPDFVEARRKLRANALEELVAMRMQVARLALKRARKKKADEYAFESGGAVIDKRPDWAKLVLDAEKNAHALAKVESADSGQGTPQQVEIHVHGPASVTGDGGSTSE